MSDNSTYTQDEQQAPTPNPDLKTLERLIGTWKVFDPSGSGAIEGRVTYAWVEGGFFLTQQVEFVQSGRTIKGLEIIGHEQTFGQEPSEEIKSRYYDYFSGQTLDYVYELEGDTLTIWGGAKGSPAYFRGEFSEDGNTVAGGWVYPGGGGYESTMTRVL